MRRCRGAALAALAALLLVAAARAQVQQEPRLETTENTGINISCSHPKIQRTELIHWYRHLPGRGPERLAVTVKESKELPEIAGGLWVSADRRSSALWLRRPRRGDAAVYYCALGDTGRGAGAAAGHEPPRAGPGGAGATAPPAASRGRSASGSRPRPGRDGAARGTPGPPAGSDHGPSTRTGLPRETPPSTRLLPCNVHKTICWRGTPQAGSVESGKVFRSLLAAKGRLRRCWFIAR
ncbi:uncharacterized protein LOC120411305 [Corvus cornix cornix]|uniref:uncharacterized protein LOC120411305 n=1 Tax=Corvus cornix cornix TaxID=932674 RepID=UPI00194E851F|nr:uncharacterized protein LOC120411305 [Corvus cornix cornix]